VKVHTLLCRLRIYLLLNSRGSGTEQLRYFKFIWMSFIVYNNLFSIQITTTCGCLLHFYRQLTDINHTIINGFDCFINFLFRYIRFSCYGLSFAM
jgi:hypothetical protein